MVTSCPQSNGGLPGHIALRRWSPRAMKDKGARPRAVDDRPRRIPVPREGGSEATTLPCAPPTPRANCRERRARWFGTLGGSELLRRRWRRWFRRLVLRWMAQGSGDRRVGGIGRAQAVQLAGRAGTLVLRARRAELLQRLRAGLVAKQCELRLQRRLHAEPDGSALASPSPPSGGVGDYPRAHDAPTARSVALHPGISVSGQ